ncbi:acyltransferase family protein [Bifidobacterium catenulatum]|uniref:acyltransferase family protein n=1 Tax=Bifidobacterium catenulatum TaxID=1686 RepID=UPI002649C729|nr:acyltransferase [Bifidobacterium catenulatum]WJO87011.1 acyltransferase [Bifidobacterium catenulatum]
MGGGWNSGIELLRIIAMFMILIHHFIVHNGYDMLKLPLGPERIFFQLVMQSGGAIGVVIFFSISAWFFLDREQTIKSNLKRVWIMERELLFWSLILVTFYLAFDRADLGMKLMAKSIMPLSMGVWWYATAYAIFLTLLPFLAKGLKALGREYHLALAATVLVIWGLTSFIPGMIGIKDGFLGFIYLFILFSAYKRYMEPFTTRQVWLMIGTGLGFFLLYTCASITLPLLGHDMGIYITGAWKLPVIMVGFGVFLLFDRVTFHNRTINRIAQSAFAVYLITEYAVSEKLLWVRLFNLQNLYQQPLTILQILGILLAIYTTCTLIDFIRQALFAAAIDRHRGRWFELLWDKVSA